MAGLLHVMIRVEFYDKLQVELTVLDLGLRLAIHRDGVSIEVRGV